MRLRFGSSTSHFRITRSISFSAVKSQPSSFFRAMSHSSSIDLSLTRIKSLLARLNNPHQTFPVIHVAGTNGKGTTTVYLDEILSKVVGLRTARFNSPHLIHQSDSCRINGQPISDQIWQLSGKWVELADQRKLTEQESSDLKSQSSSNPRPSNDSDSDSDQQGSLRSTSFEILTARTLLSYSLLPLESRPEILIIEVGLGGRLDATNVFSDQQVLASVICPIDKDHQNILGTTLREIAHQKAGIIKKNGLVVVADQRRKLLEDEEKIKKDVEVDCTLVSEEEIERKQLGKEAAEILESIRSEAESKNARMVKSFIDWDVLDDSRISLESGETLEESTSSVEPTNPWKCLISSRQRFSPTLFLPSPPPSNQGRNRSINTGLSSLFPPAKPSSTSTKPKVPTYKSSIGDVSIPGPRIEIPPTRASLTGSHTALQTLFSIARDEPPSAMGITGSDELEELKLKIAFALRSEGNGERRLMEVLKGGIRLEGRADWKWLKTENDEEVEMKDSEEIEIQGEEKSKDEEDEKMQTDENQDQQPTTTSTENDDDPSSRTLNKSITFQSILFLLDGAHNPASAKALRSYIDTCITSRLRGNQGSMPSKSLLTINWIMAFSQGKEIEEMLSSLFQSSKKETKVEGSESLEKKVEKMDLDSSNQTIGDLKIQHRICFVPFKTPVEGMPWVQSVEPSEASKILQQSLSNIAPGGLEEVLEIKEGSDSTEGLKWISNKREEEGMEMNVICGSLYLIGEVYARFQ